MMRVAAAARAARLYSLINGGESGLTLQANGGNGGNAWSTDPYSLADRHGPGGRRRRRSDFRFGSSGQQQRKRGASGLTLNPGVPYGSTAGTTEPLRRTPRSVRSLEFSPLLSARLT